MHRNEKIVLKILPEMWSFFRIRFSKRKNHSHGERGPK